MTDANNAMGVTLMDGSVKTTYKNRGIDALVDFGAATNVKKSTNSFLIAGITFDLKSDTGGSSVTVNVQTDVNSMVDKIEKYVEKYNALVDEMASRLTEKNVSKL